MTQHILTLTGPDLFAWLRDQDLTLPAGRNAKEGDVVACSTKKNFTDPADLGVVRYAERTKLPKNHRDGAFADVYVQSYGKKGKGSKQVNVLKSSFVLFFFLVWFCLVCLIGAFVALWPYMHNIY